MPVPKALSAALAPTVTLSNEAIDTASTVTVVFLKQGLVNGNVIKIYLGDTTAGTPWQLNGVAAGDISCSDDGSGETYTVNSVTAASATVPMWTQITAATLGSGMTAVTCVIGDGSPSPKNPNGAGSYSVAVVTTNDTGAGLAYVGNANDVTVSATVLPNLTLVIDTADGTACTTAAGVTSCNLGIITTAAVNTGNYTVNVGTNAASGSTLKVNDDGGLRNGSDTIDDITENTTVTAGTEGYGIAITNTGYTEVSPFDDDDTPITTSPQTVATTSGPIDPASTGVVVTHRAAISATTKALTYSHIVTWTATATF